MTEDVTVAIDVAKQFRLAGISTQIYLEQGKFKKKMAYGNKLSIPFCVLLGEDEIAANKVTIKNMETGEQVTDTVENAIAVVKAKAEVTSKFVNM